MKIESKVEVANRVRDSPSKHQDKERLRSSCACREAVPDHPDLDNACEDLDGSGADW
jgi:hypothetical protein